MRVTRKLSLTTMALVAMAGTALSGSAAIADAAVTGKIVSGKFACGNPAPAGAAAGHVAAVTARPSAAQLAAVAQYKARHNAYAARMPSLLATSNAQAARKLAEIRSGAIRPRTPSCAPAAAGRSTVVPNTQVGWLAHYDQITNWYCGPATVAEMSASVPGPSEIGLDQNAIARYMGTTASAGTTYDNLVRGLNYYVGMPDFKRNFYEFVWLSYTPTSAERSAFVSRLQTDIGLDTPIVGSAWEVAGGPHMTGHPLNQEIFHIFAIGGYNSSQVYYTDSATSVWSSVPAYSWFDTYTMETILGGRGYAW